MSAGDIADAIVEEFASVARFGCGCLCCAAAGSGVAALALLLWFGVL